MFKYIYYVCYFTILLFVFLYCLLILFVEHFWMNQCLKTFCVEIDQRTFAVLIVYRNFKEFSLINIVVNDRGKNTVVNNYYYYLCNCFSFSI